MMLVVGGARGLVGQGTETRQVVGGSVCLPPLSIRRESTGRGVVFLSNVMAWAGHPRLSQTTSAKSGQRACARHDAEEPDVAPLQVHMGQIKGPPT